MDNESRFQELDRLVAELLTYKADQFDGPPDQDLNISGADFLDYSKLSAAEQVYSIGKAIEYLFLARARLRLAGSKNAADYVARAMKSAEGALRHAERVQP